MLKYLEPLNQVRGVSFFSSLGEIKNLELPMISWEPSREFPEPIRDQITFARHYVDGMPLKEAVKKYAPQLLAEFAMISKKINAFARANEVAQSKAPLASSIPSDFIQEMILIKEVVSNAIIEEEEAPKNIDFLVKLNFALSEIAANEFLVGEQRVHVAFDPLGSATGRLRLRSGSFPITTLRKDLRATVRPLRGLLVDLDFNALDLRTFFALLEIEQPAGDPHDANAKLLRCDRAEAKKAFFSWLYGSKSIEAQKIAAVFENEYNPKKLLERYFDGEVVTNPFGRQMKCKERLAMNRLVQSTSADICHMAFLKLKKHLRGRQERILFLIHDSICFASPNGSLDFVPELCHIVEQTPFGRFPVRAGIGKTFGSLDECS